MGRAALYVVVCGGDYFLRVLLCVDCFQSQRSRRQYAEVWRVHSGHTSGQAHGRLHQRSFNANHAGGRAVPDYHLVYSRVDDHRHSLEPLALLAGRIAVRAASGVDDERAGSEFLFWRGSEEHTSELQSRENLVCRLLLEKKKKKSHKSKVYISR